MMERNSFSVLFFLKKTKLLKNGEASVCMRITVNNIRSETNIRKSITPSLWNQAKECSRGKDRKSNDLNKFIEEARIKLYNIHAHLKQEGLPITAIILRDKFFGLEEKEAPRTLIATFQEHNDQCRQLVGKRLCSGYRSPLRKLQTVLSRTYQNQICKRRFTAQRYKQRVYSVF